MTVQATGADRVFRALDTLTHPGQLDPRTLLVGAATIVLIIALERTWLGQLGPVVALAITSAWGGHGGIGQRRSCPPRGRPTVKQSLVTLRMALKQAVLWGLVPRNAAALVDGIADKPTERRPFTPDEQRRILHAARGDRLYVLVVLAHATGLRQSELLGVRWTDLNLDTRILRFTTQYGRDGILREPKTTAGLRVLPLPQSTIDVLIAHRKQQDRERATAVEWEDWGLVIATRTGRPVNHANARRSWNRIVRSAGVEHRGIHHMTREIYTHVTAPMFEAAANAICRAVDGTFGSSADATGSNGSSDPAIGSKNGSKTTEAPASGGDPPPATSA